MPPSLLRHKYRVSFPEEKWQGRGVSHSPKSSAEVKEIVELYFSPSGHSRPVLGSSLTFMWLISVTTNVLHTPSNLLVELFSIVRSCSRHAVDTTELTIQCYTGIGNIYCVGNEFIALCAVGFVLTGKIKSRGAACAVFSS